MVDILFMESVTEESIVSVKNEVDHIISGRTIETITEPVNTHISREHGIKHEILKISEGLRRGEKFVCHVPIISIGSDGSLGLLCHLSHRPPAADQFVLISSGIFHLYDLTSIIKL